MACSAFPYLDCRMDYRLVQPHLFLFMAGITEIVVMFFQQKFWDNAVPDVALFTLVIFDKGMDILHTKVFFGEFIVAFYA